MPLNHHSCQSSIKEKMLGLIPNLFAKDIKNKLQFLVILLQKKYEI